MDVVAAVKEGHVVCVAVPVSVRLYVGVTESVRLCVHVRNRVSVGVNVSWVEGDADVHTV